MLLELRFTEARMQDGWLCLKPDNKPLAHRLVALVERGKSYTAKILKTRERRSLDANAYFWVLVGKLAEVTGIRKDEIYFDLVRNLGGNTSTASIPQCAVNKFIRGWKHNGLGWLCERTGSSATPGFEDVIVYYGSSTYDTAQMARLIDLVVQECQQQDIETLPPDKLDAMKLKWNPEAAG